MVRHRLVSAHVLQLRRRNSTASVLSPPSPSPLSQRLFPAYGKPSPVYGPSLLPPVFSGRWNGTIGECDQHRGQSIAGNAQTQAHEREDSLDTYGAILQRYVGSSDPLAAQRLHLVLIKSGFFGDLFLSNSLVNLYVKKGHLVTAREIFDMMPMRNAVSWTSLISGYAQSGQSDEAHSLFRFMVSSGISPTEYTFGSVLRVCQDSGPCCLGLGSQVHALILKSGYCMDPVACNALISMYGSCHLDSMVYVYKVFGSAPQANLISWNSIISVCSQRGDVESAYQLFLCMRKSAAGLLPNEYTYGSLISVTYAHSSSSPSSFYLCLLCQVFSLTIKSGFVDDLYVGSALVSAFARFGALEKAKQILVQMGGMNSISMNGLMVGLVKQKRGEEAVEAFKEIDILGLKNCDSYVVLLSACAEFSTPEEGKAVGREIHGSIMRNDLINYKIAVGNGLVNMYAKCGAIEEALKVFEHMKCKDQVSWNSLIAGLDQNGLFEDALIHFYRMRSHAPPTNFSLISMLSSCTSLGLVNLGMQVHCDGLKLGLDVDVSVANALLELYGECGCIMECWRVFVLMPDLDLVSWNSMIGVLADKEAFLSKCIYLFSDMIHYAWNPNKITFINVLSALSSHEIVSLGCQVHALIIRYGLSEDISVQNAMLSCYAKCGDMDACEQLFVDMSSGRDNLSWNTMVSGYVDNGLLTKAMDLVWLMMHDGQKLDHYTFATVLSACASVAALARGMEMHAFSTRSHMKSDVVVESALVDMYSKCGRLNYATNVFRSMIMKNEFSWNSMISGFARHGHASKALKLFSDMQESQEQPDHVTFVGVLSACSHVGLVEEGQKYFNCMSEKYGIAPRVEHYSCMVDLFGRAGRLNEMQSFLESMPIRPNAFIWRTVLSACCRSKDSAMTNLGKQAGKMLFELEPGNPVNYILLSKLFASTGCWEDTAKARGAMRDALVKKEAGCSWVTMKDGLHVFTAGDKSHRDTYEIYANLSFLIQEARDEGYVPQTEFTICNPNMEEKEEMLMGCLVA